jgi:PKD repeat protein
MRTILILCTRHLYCDINGDGHKGGNEYGSRYIVRNVLPTVNLTAAPNPIAICNAARFTGTATDTASNRLTHNLAFGDNNNPVNTLTANHTYATPGNYTATLTSTDRFGGVGRDNVTVTVNNTPPTVTAAFSSTANPIRINDVINFNGGVVDPDSCDRHTYRWNFGDGTTATTLDAAHAYRVKGTYMVTLTVIDRFGGANTKTLTVKILGALPVVQVGSDIALDVGEAFNFSGSFTDVDGAPTYRYVWRYGDGNTSVGSVTNIGNIAVVHAFNQTGEFTATLEVTDRDGNTGSASMIVNVRGINTDPCASGVATVRSRLPWNFWDYRGSWNSNQVPNANDWVMIESGHQIILPTSLSSPSRRLQVKGLCIKQNGILQSPFNTLTTAPSWIHFYAASVRNQGTIFGINGIDASLLQGIIPMRNK